jgi:hypothetical protein
MLKRLDRSCLTSVGPGNAAGSAVASMILSVADSHVVIFLLHHQRP